MSRERVSTDRCPTPSNDLAAQRRRRSLEQARKTLPEFDRNDVGFGKFGTIEYNGNTFKVVRGIVDDRREFGCRRLLRELERRRHLLGAAVLTYSALIKIALILTLERQNDPASNKPGRFLYRSDSLRLLPSRKVPVLVDHDETREIGYVKDIVRLDDVDGPWFFGRAVVTDPPAWLKKGTPASFATPSSSRSLFSDDLVCTGFVNEISVLAPGVTPAEPLAKVVLLDRIESPAARATPDRHAAVGAIIHHTGRQVLVRPGIGQVLGIR